MRKFTKFALISAAIAGGVYLYKQIEKQKELAEGETFDDDLFEDEDVIDPAAEKAAEEDFADTSEETSRLANVKAKASDVAQKVKEKAVTIAQATKEKAVEVKDYLAEKFEKTADDAAEAAEDVADAAEEKSEDWTGKLEDVADKAEDIAVDMADAVDPD